MLRDILCEKHPFGIKCGRMSEWGFSFACCLIILQSNKFHYSLWKVTSNANMLIQEDHWCNPLRHDWRNVLWIQKVWDGNYTQLGPLEIWRIVYLVRTYRCLLYISIYYCFLIQRLACTSTSLLWEDCTTALTFIKMLTDLSLKSHYFTPFFDA